MNYLRYTLAAATIVAAAGMTSTAVADSTVIPQQDTGITDQNAVEQALDLPANKTVSVASLLKADNSVTCHISGRLSEIMLEQRDAETVIFQKHDVTQRSDQTAFTAAFDQAVQNGGPDVVTAIKYTGNAGFDVTLASIDVPFTARHCINAAAQAAGLDDSAGFDDVMNNRPTNGMPERRAADVIPGFDRW